MNEKAPLPADNPSATGPVVAGKAGLPVFVMMPVVLAIVFITLLGAAVAVGYAVHWCLPAIDLGAAVLIGAVSLSALGLGVLIVFLAFSTALSRGLEMNRRDAVDDDEDDADDHSDTIENLGEAVADALLRRRDDVRAHTPTNPSRKRRR